MSVPSDLSKLKVDYETITGNDVRKGKFSETIDSLLNMARYIVYYFMFCGSLFAIDISDLSELNSAIGTANSANTSTIINLTGNITDASAYITPLCIDSPNSSFSLLNNCTIIIDGNNYSLDQSTSYPGLFVGGNPYNTNGELTNSSSVTIQNLTITGKAKGGDSRFGGGGAGLGGGLFVNTSTAVTLDNVTFTNCSAVGGTASSSLTGQGGGGMGGKDNTNVGGGGGFNTNSDNTGKGGGCTFMISPTAGGGAGPFLTATGGNGGGPFLMTNWRQR